MDAAAGSMLAREIRAAVLRRRKAYRYDPSAGDPFYEGGSPANPRRAVMVHSCAVGLDLLKSLSIPFPVSASVVRRFHDFEFVSVRPPATDTEFDVFDLRAPKAFQGDSGAISVELNDRGSLLYGFTYVNDIVLAILELLKFRKRVLYIDIGTHHGDGVEESFFSTDRVMTVVFHRRGDHFPCSGDLTEGGRGEGQYALNVPLVDDMDDGDFIHIFECVIKKAIEVHNPDLVLLQCGPHSLERCSNNYFKLSDDHLHCLAFVKSFQPPTILLGNTSSCWCFQEVIESIAHPLRNFSYNSELVKSFKCSGLSGYVQSRTMHTMNTSQDRDKMTNKILCHLESLQAHESIRFYSDATVYEADIEDEDSEDTEIADEEYELVEGSNALLEGGKPWSNIVTRPVASLMNRFGRKLGSASVRLLSYDRNLDPYTDFLKYVGDFETGSDGSVPPMLGVVANVSRGAGFASSKAGLIMRSGGKAIGNLGQKIQMLASPESGSSGAGSAGTETIIINSMAEADEQILKWTVAGGKFKFDVPSGMSLQDAGHVFARFAAGDALELLRGSPVINQKVDRLRRM
ncbi:hypothetical protein ACQ4PT_056419 [Festuca glaucescens]